jgi:hypothetical protein
MIKALFQNDVRLPINYLFHHVLKAQIGAPVLALD